MIDEKKLIRWIKTNCNPYGKPTLDYITSIKIMEFIENNMEKVGEWIPCSERMPKSEDEVEITYTSKNYKTGEPMYFTARAFYEDGTLTTEDSDYCWNDIDNWDYCKEKDAYIIPEGWFETVNFGDECGAVDMPVIAWRLLTEPYRIE